MIKFNPLKNEKGSMIVNAIATSIIIAIISGVILQQSLTSMKTLRLPRIKSVMTSIEGSVRFMAMEPGNYTGCTDGAGFVSCQFADEDLGTPGIQGLPDRLRENIPGCDPWPCGVVVTGANYNSATRTFTATIQYQGTELAVRPVNVSLEVPMEVLTQANVLCPPAGQPELIFFKGFDTDGNKICDKIVYDGNPALDGCPQGEYLVGFDQNTMAVQCHAIPTVPVNCGADMVQRVTFDGTNFVATCMARQPPGSIPSWPVP